MLNTKADKEAVPESFTELYEDEYVTIYEEQINGMPFIHTLIYKWNKNTVPAWTEAIQDIGDVLAEEGHVMMFTYPHKENKTIIKAAKRAGFEEHQVVEEFMLMKRVL